MAILVLIGTSLPTGLHAQAASVEPVTQNPAWLDLDDGAADGITLLPAMDLRRWPDNAFFEAMVSRVNALSEAHAEEHGAVLLDLAELYLSQMLTVEAESFVRAAGETAWASSPRHAALRDAVNLLQGQPVAAIATSPLTDPIRPDRGLWLSLNGIAIGDGAKLDNHLQEGLVGLTFQSGPVARALLPLVAEAAISLRNLPLSETALALIGTVPDLVDTPSTFFLQGRHDENLGNVKSALEAYFEASRGWDRYAARARIALADLAMRDGSSGALLAARDVLSAGAGSWRGDEIEITVLERQAQVNGLLGESITALKAYGRILTRFPNSPQAAAAKDVVGGHLDVVYRRGAAGEIALANWFEVHQFLLPAYRFLPRFVDYNEMLADAVFKMGGTYLAISEYQQTLSIYEALDDVTGAKIEPARVDAVRKKLALALARAGLWGQALDSLDEITSTGDPVLRDGINKLRVQVLSELGDTDGLLRTFVATPDAESLRRWGQALFVSQDWANAMVQYQRLLSDYPDQFRLGDASYLLIAAHRVGDEETARQVAQSFPQLTTSEGIAGLANSLLEPPEPLLPLRQDAASGRLERVDETIDLIEDSGL